jgi:ribosomal protein S21
MRPAPQERAIESEMPTDSVRCRVDILVVDGKLEEALRDLRKSSGGVLRELRKRRRVGPKPSEKRRNKRWFANRFLRLRWKWRDEDEDEFERARRDQEMFTRRCASQRAQSTVAGRQCSANAEG